MNKSNSNSSSETSLKWNWRRMSLGGLLLAAMLALPLVQAGCQTTKGVGRDLEKLGDNIEDAAERND